MVRVRDDHCTGDFITDWEKNIQSKLDYLNAITSLPRFANYHTTSE
jgi:hypothetical protein